MKIGKEREEEMIKKAAKRHAEGLERKIEDVQEKQKLGGYQERPPMWFEPRYLGRSLSELPETGISHRYSIPVQSLQSTYFLIPSLESIEKDIDDDREALIKFLYNPIIPSIIKDMYITKKRWEKRLNKKLAPDELLFWYYLEKMVALYMFSE